MNEEIISISLSRNDVCDVLMAIHNVEHDYMQEIRDEGTDETRREIAKSSLQKWEKLHGKIKEQISAQDEPKPENPNFTDCTDIRYQMLLERFKLERRLNSELRGQLKKLSIQNEELETELQQYRTLVRDIDNALGHAPISSF